MKNSLRILTLITLVLMITAALVAPALGMEKQNVIELEKCPSGVLLIELNVDSQTSRSGLLKALKFISGTSMTATVQPSTGERIALKATVSGTDCPGPESCVAAEWVSLQKRLNKIKGVAFSCFHPAPSSKSNTPARSERGGSVTGSN